MMTNIVCFVVIMLCAMSSIINSQSGLSALLSESNTNSSTSSATLSARTTGSGLSALLSTPVASSAPETTPVNPQAGLLQQFITVQSNPLYVKAMAILNDTELKVAYSNSLFSIQLFFMQYASDDLNKLSATAAQSKPSLSSLLTTALSSSASQGTNSGVMGLASLLSAAQGTSVQPISKNVQQSSITSVLSQMNAAIVVKPVAVKKSAGLQSLLDAVATSTGNSSPVSSTVTPVVATSQTDSLSTLLAAQG